MIVYATRRKKDGGWWNRWTWHYEDTLDLGSMLDAVESCRDDTGSEIVEIELTVRVIGAVKEKR